MFQIKPNSDNKGRKGRIATDHGDIQFPSFMPDATYGTIHSLSFEDVKQTGIEEIVTTTLHIEQSIGSEYLEKYGGIHKFTGWNRPVLTDSGGFQVFSLIYRNENKANKITEVGCSFIEYKTGSYKLLTPEISQVIQKQIGSDIRLVLDIPLKEDASLKLNKKSVDRNTRWAQRSKDMFLKLHNLTKKQFNDPKVKRPLLGAIIQGANDFDLRKRSAEDLIKIGFDIYCYGGLPLTKPESWRVGHSQQFHHEMVAYVADLIPEDKIRYAMGVGTPDDLYYASSVGWDLFDTVLPTRNARHGYLYVHKGQGDASYETYDVLHVKNARNKFADEPIDAECDCECCTTVSRAYLRYLIKTKSATGHRLATIHNLHFYSSYMLGIRNRNDHSK